MIRRPFGVRLGLFPGVSFGVHGRRSGGVDPLSLAYFAFRASDSMLDAGGAAVSDAEAIATITNLATNSASAPSAYEQILSQQPVATIGASNYATFDGTSDRVQSGSWRGSLTSAVTLPDGAQGASTGKGWTCTGLAKAADGTWWIGNDGRPGTEASVVHVSADFSTILDEIDFNDLYSYTGTIQGVAIDPSDGSLWVAFSTEEKVHHIDPSDGSKIESIDTSALGLGDPNGVAWDPTDDTLLIGMGLAVRRYSTSTLAVTESLPNTPGGMANDHLHVTSDGTVWMSRAATSTSPGSVWNLDGVWRKVADLTEADSIEGLWVSNDKTQIVVANDAFFHGGSPALNRALTFNGALLSPSPGATILDFAAKLQITSSPTGATRASFSVGSMIDGPGCGFVHPTNTVTSVGLVINTGSGSSNRDFIYFTVPSLSAEAALIRFRIDLPSGSVRMWRNGTELTSQTTIKAGSSISTEGFVSVGGNALNSLERLFPGRVYGASAAFNVTEEQGADLAELIDV